MSESASVMDRYHRSLDDILHLEGYHKSEPIIDQYHKGLDVLFFLEEAAANYESNAAVHEHLRVQIARYNQQIKIWGEEVGDGINFFSFAGIRLLRERFQHGVLTSSARKEKVRRTEERRAQISYRLSEKRDVDLDQLSSLKVLARYHVLADLKELMLLDENIGASFASPVDRYDAVLMPGENWQECPSIPRPNRAMLNQWLGEYQTYELLLKTPYGNEQRRSGRFIRECMAIIRNNLYNAGYIALFLLLAWYQQQM